MTDNTDHTRKVNRALRLSAIGIHPASASAMLRAIPAEVIAATPARLIAQMIDANWRLASASKAIAARDALTNGGAWDEARGAMREFAQ